MKFYIEVHEARVFQLTVAAPSEDAAKAHALELARSGELTPLLIDREVIALQMSDRETVAHG